MGLADHVLDIEGNFVDLCYNIGSHHDEDLITETSYTNGKDTCLHFTFVISIFRPGCAGINSPEPITEMATCQCGEPSTHTCANCKGGVCDDINCGIDTVDGYLCGTYTHWGCSKKYTTCDQCCDDKAIHEDDFVQCVDCYMAMCESCALGDYSVCAECEHDVCQGCKDTHECYREDEEEETGA